MVTVEDWTAVRDALQQYLATAQDHSGPVIQQPPIAELASSLAVDEWILRGELRGSALAQFLRTYLGASTRLHHAGYMAHQVAIPEPLAAVGALVEAITNNVGNLYEMGPAATTIEFALLNWMLRKVGWKAMPAPGVASHGEDARIIGGGTFTNGGSLANLTALFAARSRVSPHAWRAGIPHHLVVIVPESAHYSIARAVDLLGLGQDSMVAPPTTPDGRIRPDALGPLIQELWCQGREILAVVATAGATGSGLFDDLEAIGSVCQETATWLHVDGAHGASALLSDVHRHLLAGVVRADSLTWDAHKMLRTPALCTALLVRDHRVLDAAFHQDASYLFHDKDQPGVDFLHRTLECTRSGVGLRLFLALAAHGERGIAGYIDRQVALAKEAGAYLASTPGITLAVEPEFNIVCFRVEGNDGLQLEIRRRLLVHGDHYVTTTRLRGQRWLRLALMSPATEIDDIRRLVIECLEHRSAILTDETVALVDVR